MSNKCAECGAVLLAGRTCQALFDEFLTLEFTDPAYGRVHFLTVACFMIQHGRYSDAGLDWIGATLRAYLEQNLTHQQLSRLAAQSLGSHTRTWKVTRPVDAPPLPQIAWSLTIADVVPTVSDPAAYCAQVTQWARATLREMAVAS